MSDTSATRKKGRERFYLDQFLKVAKLVPDGVDQRESPDFIIKLGHRRIGIELANLYIDPTGGPKSMQAEESYGNRLVSRARRLYIARDGRPCLAHVLFKSGNAIGSADRQETAQLLAAFLYDEAPTDGIRLRFDWDRLNGRVPDVIHSVHVLGVPSHELGRWDVARAGFVAPLKQDLVRGAICSKANKLPAYRTEAETVWLLLVIDRLYASQMLEFDASFPTEAIESPFDETFVFCPGEAQCVRIGVSGRGV